MRNVKKTKTKAKLYRLWHKNLAVIAQELSQQSFEGWHLLSIDEESGVFTFEKGLARNFVYFFNTQSEKQNVALDDRVDQHPEYALVIDSDALHVFRKELESAGISLIRTFESSGDEVRWLSEKAEDGMVLVAVHDDHYYFASYVPDKIKFSRANTETLAENESACNDGLYYISTSNGHHYYRNAVPKKKVETKTTLLRGKKAHFENKMKQAINILAFALVGVGAATLKMFFDFRNFRNATPDTATPIRTRLIMDAIAFTICLAIVIGTLLSRSKADKKVKAIETKIQKEQENE